mgnify:CR=1 FL=1
MNASNDARDGWRALPVTAVGALYVRGIQRFVRENLLAFAGAGTGFAVSDALGWAEFAGIALLILLGGLLIALIYHRRFRYRTDDAAVRVRQGLFERKELKVRFERVQNVGFSQPVYLKPFALTRVTLETPGAAQTEVELPGIATDEALALRDEINGVRGSATPGRDGVGSDPNEDAGSADRPDVVFHAGAADLFRYGLTSNQVWILLGIVGPLAGDWFETRFEGLVESLTAAGILDAGQLAGAPFLVGLAVIGVVFTIALILMLLSGLLAIVRFHGFTLTRDEERFRGSFGLLDAREKTLRKAKLHSVELVQTGIGRLVGNWHVIGHQTGMGEVQQQPGGGDRRFLVPGLDTDRLPAVASALSQRSWSFPEVRAVDRRLRTVLWTRICVPLLLLGALLAWGAGGRMHWPAIGLAALAGLLAAAMHLRWKRWGWAQEGDRLTVRSGFIGQRWMAFDLDRCQQIRLVASPYQRRHGLATLRIRLPHGEQQLPYLPRRVADRLVNIVLERVERARMHGL